MRVLLTGATGFLGSHLAHAWIAAGHDVGAVVRPTSDTCRLDSIQSQLCLIDPASIESSMSALRPDAVVHAATCYGRRGESEAEMRDANITFPLRLLRHALEMGTALFINTDTTLPSQINLYARTKAQFVTASQPLVTDRLRFANVRLESLYGPGDDHTKFPTQAVRACVRDVPELLLTMGEQMRDYIYIDDAVDAFSMLLRHASRQPQGWQDYDLGTGHPSTLREFVETAKRESGSRTELRFGALPYRVGELMRSSADVSVLHALGWHASTSLADGVRKVITYERTL